MQRRQCHILLAMAWLAGPVPAWAQNASGAEIAGHYYLESGREVGSELLLKPDHRFAWMLAYGAIDQYATGQWSLAGDTLVLQATPPAGKPAFRMMEENELRIRKPAAPGSWVAMVGLPGVGPAPGMEVCFEARSGRQVSATSNAQGDAIVPMPAHEQWARVGVRRQGSQDAWQWLAVPPARAAARMAGLAIDDEKWLVPQAFERMVLRRQGGKLVSEDGRMVYARP